MSLKANLALASRNRHWHAPLRSQHVFDEYLHHYGRRLGLAETTEPVIRLDDRDRVFLRGVGTEIARPALLGRDWGRQHRSFEIRIDSSWLNLRA
jgi:hypothetical protein